MNIHELLNKYFEGETSFNEEQQLRSFFASKNVPEELKVYKPLFAYFDEEIAKESKKKIFFTHRRVYYWISAVAASILLFFVLDNTLGKTDPCTCSGNYVVINGRCYNDIEKVRSLALEAMREVATPAEDYFIEEDIDEIDKKIVDNQLKELSNLFSDEE